MQFDWLSADKNNRIYCNPLQWRTIESIAISYNEEQLLMRARHFKSTYLSKDNQFFLLKFISPEVLIIEVQYEHNPNPNGNFPEEINAPTQCLPVDSTIDEEGLWRKTKM